MRYAALLVFLLLAPMNFVVTSSARASDWAQFGKYLGGFFLFSLVHEGGHALTALAYDRQVTAFRPYPNICGDTFRPGCIIYRYKDGEDRDPALLARQDRNIAIAGTASSVLSVLAFAPLVPKLGTGFFAQTCDSMLFMQVRDFPIYIVSDMTGYEGDWSAVAKHQGYPVSYLLPAAAATYLGLDAYHNKFRKSSFKSARQSQRSDRVDSEPSTRSSGNWVVLPRYYPRYVHGVHGLGLTAQVDF